MTTNEHHVRGVPATLRERLLANRVVLFAGAGLSRPAGAPSWRGLLQGLVEHFADELVSIPDQKELVALIETGNTLDLLYAAQHLQTIRKDLVNDYIRNLCSSLLPQPIHTVIAKIPWAGIVTTNYDNLIETAIQNESKKAPNVILPSQIENLVRMEDRAPWVLKMHGTFEDPDTSVLSFSDYRSLMVNCSLAEAVSRLFQQYTVLFAGFGLEDPDTADMLTRICILFQGRQRVHYALLDGKHLGSIRKKQLLESYSIQAITYDKSNDSHPEVLEYFNELLTIKNQAGVTRMSKVLFVVRGVGASQGAEPLLLVTDSNPQWRVSEDVAAPAGSSAYAYLLPNLADFDQPQEKDVAEAFGRYFDLERNEFELKTDSEPFKTEKFNPALNARTHYTFRFACVKLKRPNSKFENAPFEVGGRVFDWRSVLDLRKHTATMALNGDVILELCRRYGSNLERSWLSVARSIPRAIDPYEFRSASYGSLPWIRDRDLFRKLSSPSTGVPGVLDLACGVAAFGEFILKETKLQYVGLDHSPRMVQMAQAAIGDSPRAKILQMDIVQGSSEERYDHWLFVLKNALHLIPRLHQCITTLATRFGVPCRLEIVETVSPNNESLCWIQTLFEQLGLVYKQHWFLKDQLATRLRYWGLEVERDELVEQYIDIDKWLTSFSLEPQQRKTVESLITAVPDGVRESMKIRETSDKRREMLRLQNIVSVRFPPKGEL